MRITEAETALADLKDNAAAQSKIDASKAKYQALKAKYEAELQNEMADKQKTESTANPN